MVRAKFRVTSIEQLEWGTIVRLKAQYDDSIDEDKRFAKATPTASVEMQIDNLDALAEFALGKTFYVDFTKV